MKTLIFRTHLSADGGMTRAEKVNGVDYLVAPVIAIVEGVLNSWLVTAEAIEGSAKDWDGIPLTVNHPEDETGQHVSIHHSDLLEKIAIGEFKNVRYIPEQHALAGEIWVDVERAAHAGDEGVQIVETLRNNEPLEVSTGYFVPDLEHRAGVFNGVAFTEVHLSLAPDHLALLPNAVGACSWSDGCGAPRINLSGRELRQQVEVRMKTKKAKETPGTGGEPTGNTDELRVNGKKLGQVLTRMVSDQADGESKTEDSIVKRMAEAAGHSMEKVKQVMAGKVDFPPRKWLQGYALALDIDLADLILAADVDTIPYRRPEQGAFGFNEAEHQPCGCQSNEVHMNKKQKVDALIANSATRFAEGDREWLMSLEEPTLDKLVPNEAQPPAATPETPAAETPAGDPPAETPAAETPAAETPAGDPPAAPAPAANVAVKPAPVVTNAAPAAKKTQTTAEALAAMPDELREIFSNALDVERQKRASILKALKKDARCPLSDAELEGMKTNTLQRLAESYEIEDYGGAGSGTDGDLVDNEAIPAAPAVMLAPRK